MEYPSSSAYNLHFVTSQDILSSRYLNFYVVYDLKSINTSSSDEVSLFKITTDETTSNKLNDDYGLSYISSTMYIGNSDKLLVQNNEWELKANTTQINKLMCVSVHWDQNNVTNPKKGNLYVNGKEICSFHTNFKKSHTSTTKLYVGSKNKNHGQINGEIFYVYISTRRMKYPEILINHYSLCEKYNIDFDKDEILEYMYK